MNLHRVRGLFLGLALLAILTVLSPASALNVPALRGRVNDYAGLMTPERARALEERLARFEKETGHQIAVLTIPSLEGDNLEGFSIRVAESWKIGKKGFDNGAILLVAKNDRKLRIEVGYGLEGVLPDALASRIIREVIVPRFRANDFAGGIEAGLDAIMKVTRGEVLPQRSDQDGTPPLGEVLSMVFAALIFIVVLSKVFGIFGYLLAFSSTIRTPVPAQVLGGISGAATATATGIFLQSIPGLGLGPLILIWSLVLLTGMLAGALTAAGAWRNQRWRIDTGRGKWGWLTYGGVGTDSSSSHSGWSSFSGSSSSGSSFSGGGGSFGGGGASGSW